MFENLKRGRQARNFTTNVPKILDLKSSSEQIFPKNWRWVPLYFRNTDFHLFSVLCSCYIGIWKKFQKRGKKAKQRAYPENQRLTKTLLFVSAVSVFSWLPYAIMEYLIWAVHENPPWRITTLDWSIVILNYFNSLANPIKSTYQKYLNLENRWLWVV